ncbi:MAG: radical SAM protein [Candidatus Freyarchaeota archaeon]|nr:radical SAM protein [Candidatus Jordarchaeia archaeon]
MERRKALDIKIKNFGKNIWCYSPSILTYSIDQHRPADNFRFCPISVTGRRCQLQCDHCRAQILESMFPAETPERLETLIKDFVRRKTEGILISGGSDLDGAVPLLEFIPALKKIKEQYNLFLVVHTGLITQDLASGLTEVGVDAVMLDIIGDDETIKKVYHLQKTVKDFERSLELLDRYNIPSVPHVVVGLNYGKISGELNAVDMISKHRPEALVIVALMPLENTPMQDTVPPKPSSIANVITYSRIKLPKTPIILGCARPRGAHRISTDILAIKSGVNGIAFISQEGADYAEKKGFKLKFSDHCCSLIFKDIKSQEKT